MLAKEHTNIIAYMHACNLNLTMKFKNGPNRFAVGCTHASVSANNNPVLSHNAPAGPLEIAIFPIVDSETDDTTDTSVASIIDKEVVEEDVIGDVGKTNANTFFVVIIDAIISAQNEKRCQIIVFLL